MFGLIVLILIILILQGNARSLIANGQDVKQFIVSRGGGDLTLCVYKNPGKLFYMVCNCEAR